MADKNLTNLLKWGIENSVSSPNGSSSNGAANNGYGREAQPRAALPAPSGEPHDAATSAAEAPARTGGGASAVDPELLKAIFGGPSDADLMRAAMEVITDASAELGQRLIALDNFEQLIESIDNANNMAVLGLWAPLIRLLQEDYDSAGDSSSSSSSNDDNDNNNNNNTNNTNTNTNTTANATDSDEAADALRRMAAGCVGTAVQNNAPAQARLVAEGGIAPLARLATRRGADDRGVRRKAVFALSSAVRNFQPATDLLAAELTRLGRHDGAPVDASDMDVVDRFLHGLRNPPETAT